jgi:hypothetical protein
LSDAVPIQNGLKQGDALSSLFFNFALEYATKTAYENREGLELNGTHQPLIYADDVNLQGDNINIIKKNNEALVDASKEVVLQVNTKSLSTYTFMSHHHTTGHNHLINITNKSFENVVKFKCLGMTVTNQNYTHVEIKNRLNSGNACYHAVKNLLSSCLLSRNKKIKIYKIIILFDALFCMGVKLGLSH